MSSELVDLRVSRSQSSIKMTHNKYQQTTPSIEASLKAGLAIGANMSKKTGDVDEYSQAIENSAEISERKSRRLKSPDARKEGNQDISSSKKLKRSGMKMIASPQTLDTSEVDFRGIIYDDNNNDEEEEEGNKTLVKTNDETVIRRGKKTTTPLSSQTTQKSVSKRLQRQLAKEMDNTPPNTQQSDDLNKTYLISTSQEDESSAHQKKTRGMRNRKVTQTPTTSTPHSIQFDNHRSPSDVVDYDVEMKIDDTIPVVDNSTTVTAQTSGNGSGLREALRNMFVERQSSSRSSAKRSMRVMSKSRDRSRGGGGATNESGTGGRVEKRRRAVPPRNQMETALELDDTNEFTLPQAAVNSQQVERVLNFSMRGDNNDISIRRQHEQEHAKTNKEKELDDVDEELRKALRPHVPPPRRSERLRMKRAKKLHEKRLALLNQIEAENQFDSRRPAALNVNMKHVTVRKKRREA